MTNLVQHDCEEPVQPDWENYFAKMSEFKQFFIVDFLNMYKREVGTFYLSTLDLLDLGWLFN